MNRLELWFLGLTCHAWRNRSMLLWLVLVVPLITCAALHLMESPDIRPEQLK